MSRHLSRSENVDGGESAERSSRIVAPDRSRRGDRTSRWPAWLVGLGHAVVVLGLAAASVGWWSSAALRSSAMRCLDDGAVVWATFGRLSLHVSLVAVGWGIGSGVLRTMCAIWRPRTSPSLGGREHVAASSSGTVVVETLVVLPVALTLIAGLMQLAVNNMAALTANFAAYEASRTVWIWEGERGASGGGEIDEETLARYARVQAASILAPVAPGSFHFPEPGLPGRAEKARRMFLAANLPVPFHDSGASVADPGHVYTRLEGRHGSPTHVTAVRALDPNTMPVKTARKFTWAFHATSVELEGIDEPRDLQDRSADVSVTLAYQHLCAFPFVGALFGDAKSIRGREGYYATFEKTVTRERQPPATEQWPKWEGGGGIERPIDYY